MIVWIFYKNFINIPSLAWKKLFLYKFYLSLMLINLVTLYNKFEAWNVSNKLAYLLKKVQLITL